MPSTIAASLAPWLSVPDGEPAVTFYKKAFIAEEKYRLEMPGGLVVRLSVDGAEFWLSWDEGVDNSQLQPIGGNSVRMILTVANPEELFALALKAGATEVFPVREEHGWLLGKITDPFGLEWEIGHPLEDVG